MNKGIKITVDGSAIEGFKETNSKNVENEESTFTTKTIPTKRKSIISNERFKTEVLV